MDLYDPLILEYQKKDTQYGKRPDAGHRVSAYNPVCGDAFDIWFDVQDGRMRDVRFSGYGCAVSRSSTAVLTEMLEGKLIDELHEAVARYLRFVENGQNRSVPEKWIPFRKAGLYPGRLKCATLAWDELHHFFTKRQ
jgi:nitrogen fixation NifU-like protein